MNIIGQLLCSLKLDGVQLAFLLLKGDYQNVINLLRGSDWTVKKGMKFNGIGWVTHDGRWVLFHKPSRVRAHIYFKGKEVKKITIPKF